MKQVALLIETSNAYARGLLRGITAYSRAHNTWSLHLAEHSRGDRPAKWLTHWKGDGIIARIETSAIARALKEVRFPMVDVSAARLLPSLPWFETDDASIAQLAFEHLRERGFRRWAYCGDDRFNWSNWRGEHFGRAVQAEGGECIYFRPGRRLAQDDVSLAAHLVQWVRKLPKPIGIMAGYDLRGVQLLDACRRANIAVPEQIAVIGVDNDDLLCELASPPLSSVMPNTHRTGYEAAALLDRLMAGEPLRPETHLIAPAGIATRQSTDILAVEDPRLAAVVRFIREQACKGINVKDVLKAFPQSRRVLESRFRRVLGRTPHEEILRVQLNRVKDLLVQTALPMSDIAERAGFAHVEYMSVAFKRVIGVPPGAYRKRNR